MTLTSFCRSPLRAAARMRSRVRATASGSRDKSLLTSDAAAGGESEVICGSALNFTGGGLTAGGGLIVSVRTRFWARSVPLPGNVNIIRARHNRPADNGRRGGDRFGTPQFYMKPAVSGERAGVEATAW